MAIIGVKAKEIKIGNVLVSHLEVFYYLPDEDVTHVYSIDENSEFNITGYLKNGILYLQLYLNEKHIETHIHKGYSKLEIAIKQSI